MKKITSLFLLLLSSIAFAQNAPITFEAGEQGANWTWTTFENVDNAPLDIIPNPDPQGINTSPTVARYTALQAGAPFAGFESQHGSDIGTFTFTEENAFIKIMVWKSVISDVGIKFATSTNASTGEIKVANTLINQWEELTFDFSGKIGETNDQIIIFPDFQNGRTSDNICYIDNITFGVPVVNPSLPTLPMDFESSELLFNYVNFGGATTTRIANPDQSGINPSAFVSQSVKQAGAEVFAGSFLNLGTPIDFTENLSIRMKTWSPQAGIIVKMKLENTSNAAINVEIDVVTTVANAWEELTFTFPESVTQNPFQRWVIFFDFGNIGNDSTFYFDDVTNDEPLSTPSFVSASFKMYPNPSNGNLTIDSQLIIDEIQIYSILGQQVMQIKPASTSTNFDISALNSGVYLVKTSSNGTTNTKRLVKN